MNNKEFEILNNIIGSSYKNQRVLAEETGYSIGTVNKAVKKMISEGYLSTEYIPTLKAGQLAKERKPEYAIILAAGFGMRMIPINMETPKGLLKVKGEVLIERLIRQLREADVHQIDIVVGFMKESYEYLIDDFGVNLIVNPSYASKNNLHSLKAALKEPLNTYIMPCDIWCKENPFHRYEFYSWYMVSDQKVIESNVRVNRNEQLVSVVPGCPGNQMIGISYLLKDDVRNLIKRVSDMAADSKNDNQFWEAALISKDSNTPAAKVVKASEVIEINTYEQLRELDNDSNQLKSDAISTIAEVFSVSQEEITNIAVLKKGMTNRSFVFQCNGEKYIMRIPGEGTEQLIDRRKEAEVYYRIAGKGLCDDAIYINPDNGYKITKYLNNTRACDPDSPKELKACMNLLRTFHEMKIRVSHTFDIFDQIEQYERLWQGRKSIYRDYDKTKQNVFKLKEYIDSVPKEWCLTHIDAVPDNFLFYKDESGKECLQLTDWEYAGMQDPHVDIAMFCIYSIYNKEQIDRLIHLYFNDNCDLKTIKKIYCYISVCGLLWSNWCEFKRNLGVEFGEYSLYQYRYAKEYYRLAMEVNI